MSAISWKSVISGNWNVATDWSAGAIPTGADDVTIAAGTYTVTIGDARAAKSLTLNDAGATVTDNGTLALTGVLKLTAGTFTLSSGALLNGGTVAAGGNGLFVVKGGTLSGVTYQGTLDLSQSPSYVSLTIANGLTLAGAGGTGAGAVQLTGYGDYLYIANSTTLNNATINIGNASAYDYLYLSTSGVTLTLGSQLTLQQSNLYAEIYSYYTNDAVINKGTVAAGVSGGDFRVYYGTFSNQGLINVSNGDTLDFGNTTFSNAGTVTVNGGVLLLNAWSNSGTINASGGTINLGGSFTAAQLSTLNLAGATVGITGTLNETGATLALGTGILSTGVTLSGTISGGVIADAGGGLIVTDASAPPSQRGYDLSKLRQHWAARVSRWKIPTIMPCISTGTKAMRIAGSS